MTPRLPFPQPHPLRAGAELGALNVDGLAQCPAWRSTGLPRAALLASPAVWLGERLVAAPLTGFGPPAIRALPLHPLLSPKNLALSH